MDKAPVHEGQEVDVLVEAIGGKGDGIAKVKGFVLFVANAKKGDEVRVKVTKVLANVAFAEIIGKAEGRPDSGSSRSEPKKPKKPAITVEVDEKTGKEKIKGAELEAEYDPSKDSEDF